MSWFKRLKEGIQTATRNKKEAPEGLWYKCDRCKETSTVKELRENFYKCPKCNYNEMIPVTWSLEGIDTVRVTTLSDYNPPQN